MNYDILKNKTILYVEDEVQTQQMLIFNIEDYFEEILTASNAFEGFAIFQEKGSQIDLIVTDIQMPNMSGLDLARAIRKFDEKIPIVFLSAYNEKEYLHQAIEVFASGFVMKPFIVDELLLVLQKAFERDK